MTEADLLTLFRRSGALHDGHFRLSSGLHSPGYLQCALVLQHPRDAEALGAALGNAVRALGATTVLSPALGGIVIGQEVGRALGVRAIFAERQDGTLMLRRGFTRDSLPPGSVITVEGYKALDGSMRANGTALTFEASEGQGGNGADFFARGSGYAIALDDGKASLTLAGPDGPRTVQLALQGAGAGEVEGEGLLPGSSNYLLGPDASQLRPAIANHQSVAYRGFHDGRGPRFYGPQRPLEPQPHPRRRYPRPRLTACPTVPPLQPRSGPTTPLLSLPRRRPDPGYPSPAHAAHHSRPQPSA